MIGALTARRGYFVAGGGFTTQIDARMIFGCTGSLSSQPLTITRGLRICSRTAGSLQSVTLADIGRDWPDFTSASSRVGPSLPSGFTTQMGAQVLQHSPSQRLSVHAGVAVSVSAP